MSWKPTPFYNQYLTYTLNLRKRCVNGKFCNSVVWTRFFVLFISSGDEPNQTKFRPPIFIVDVPFLVLSLAFPDPNKNPAHLKYSQIDLNQRFGCTQITEDAQRTAAKMFSPEHNSFAFFNDLTLRCSVIFCSRYKTWNYFLFHRIVTS